MPDFKFTAPDGTVHVVTGPEGATEAEAFQILKQRMGGTPAPTQTLAAATAPEFDEDLPPLEEDFTATPGREVGGDILGTAGEFVKGTLGDIFGEEGVAPASQIKRGAGLAARVGTGIIPRTAAGVADLGATLSNLLLPGVDLPTGSTENVDLLLDRIFPRPETTLERLGAAGGEALLTGGAAAATLVPKAGAVAATPSTQSGLRALGDEIGEFLVKSPGKFAAAETAGGAGAEGAGQLAERADLGPVGQLLSRLFGGIAGGVAPTSALRTARGAKAAIQDKIPGLAPERRAAKSLQEAVADPEAVAQAALTARKGVTPAQAADSPTLRAKEQRVLEDAPEVAAQVAAGKTAAQEATLDELASQFGPGTDRRVWEQNVVSRAAPEGAEIPIGEVDDMVRSTAQSFNRAYRDAEGFPIRDEVVRVEGGNVPLRETIADAAADPAVLTGQNVRNRIGTWLEGRYDALVTRGERVGGPDDAPLTQVDSADLLELRQVVRQQQRQKAAAGRTSADAQAEAELLNNADRAITDALESQLPAEASAALRATDARYTDFKVVEGAVVRSGDKGLTPQALQASLRGARTPGQVARGETGELGVLAEQGRPAADLLKPSATDAQARRLIRNMAPEQRLAVRSDLNAELSLRASQRGKTDVDGAKYLKEIDANEARLRASGFEDKDISNMRQIGRELKMIQSRNPAAVDALLTGDVNKAFRLVAAIAGSRAGTRALKLLGGTGGAGPSLILAQFGSRTMQQSLTRLSIDKADEIIRAAMTDRELFAALMTKPTDTIKVQADAARTINAWLAQVGQVDETKGDLTHDGFPVVENADGTFSSEVSITINDPRINEGKPTNIPSLWNRKRLDQNAAIEAAVNSGRTFQSFKTLDAAAAAAAVRSEEKSRQGAAKGRR